MKRMSDKTAAVIVFAIFGILSVLLFSFLPKIHIEGTQSLVPKNDPALLAMNRMEKEFGDADQILVIVQTSGVFEEKNARVLYSTVQDLKKLPDVKNVQSIFDAANAKFTIFGFKYTPYFKNGIPTREATEILKSNLYVGNLVDPQGKVTAIVVYLKKHVGNPTAEIEKVLKTDLSKSMEYHLTGEDVVNYSMNKSIFILAIFYPPLLFGLMWLLYFLRIGNVVGAAIPPLLAALAAMWTYGVAGMANLPLNMLTATVGIFIIVVSSSYGLHLIDRYMFNRSRFEHHEAVVKTLKEEGVPIIMSALTTVVGFITFIFAGISAFKTFGLLVSTGVGISALFALILIPALTKFFDIRKRTVKTLSMRVNFSRKFVRISLFVIFVFLALSPLFISRVSVNSDEFSYFKYDSAVRTSARVARKYFGWVLPLYVMVEKNGPFNEGDAKALEKFISEIEKIPGVSSVNSALDISKAFNVPLPILQALSKNPNYSKYFSQWFHADTTRFLVKTPVTDTNGTVKIAKAIKRLSKEFPQYKISLTSPTLTYAAMNSSIIVNQISTIFLAFIFILVLLVITFRSVLPPLIASVPIVLTVVFNFAFMGLLRVNLDVSTAIISSVLMGLVIDYSIHTISRYRMTKDINEVIKETGPVIAANAFGLVFGFLTLLFSPLRLYMQLGGLLALGIAIGAFLTLLLVVELLRVYDRRLKKSRK